MSTESGPSKSGWGMHLLKWDQQVIFSWHIQFKVFVKKLQVFSGFHFSLGGSAEPPEQP